jgi:hypothetical protein
MLDGRAVGVKMYGGEEIRCKRAVVSSAGYFSTLKLLSEKVTTTYKIPRDLKTVQQSAGFVMCNIGINASPEEIGVTNSNTWHVSLSIFMSFRRLF